MGFKLKAPKISVPSVHSIVSNVSNTVSQAGRDINTTFLDTKKTADKSDIGKTVGAVATPAINAATVVPRTVYGAATGTLEEQNQKTLGSLLSKFMGSGSGLVGTSPAAQKLLNNPTFDKISGGLSADYAGASKGAYTLNKGYVSQTDRDDIYRFGAKSGVIFAGAMTAASYFGGASESGGAVLVENGAPLAAAPTVTTAPAAGVLASATQATPVAASVGAGTAATSGGGLTSYLGYAGAAGLGAKLLSGQVTPGQAVDVLTGGGFNPDHPGTTPPSSGILDSIGSLFSGGASDTGAVGSPIPSMLKTAIVPILAIGAIAYIAHRKKFI